MTTKQQIIQELSQKNILDCQILQNGNFWGYLGEEGKREVSSAIFENIKRHSEGWTIKQVRTANVVIYDKAWLSQIFPRAGVKSRETIDETLLVHNSEHLRWDRQGFLIWDYRKIQPLDDYFTAEQINELQQLLPTYQTLIEQQRPFPTINFNK